MEQRFRESDEMSFLWENTCKLNKSEFLKKYKSYKS